MVQIFFLKTFNVSVSATLVSYILLYVVPCILTVYFLDPCPVEDGLQPVSTEQKLKCDTSVRIMYRYSFLPWCISDVCNNLATSLGGFYTVLWFDSVCKKKNDYIVSCFILSPCYFFIGDCFIFHCQ